jgi:hypothetical protein
MTWSLKLHNGDLQLGGKGFEKVIDDYKLAQDLKCHILQKMGDNDLHPQFGSLIDGGVDENGKLQSSVIGTSNQELAIAMIRSELIRVLNNYQDSQLSRAKLDKTYYNKATLTPKEVLFSISSIDIYPDLTTLYVRINIVTGKSTKKTIELTF